MFYIDRILYSFDFYKYMGCNHNDCTLFEGGVDKMPGKRGYSYLMCAECHRILAYKNDYTGDQHWEEGIYKLYGIWSKLDKKKEENKFEGLIKRIEVIESKLGI